MTRSSLPRLAFLASGRGSNFEAICKAVRQGDPAAELVGLICNRPKAGVLEIARTQGVPATVLDSKKLAPQQYEKELLSALQKLKPDWICLTGYMKILSAPVIQAYPGRILNIHPSLLPAFKGLRAQEQALRAGVKTTGCTVHVVTESLDDGPIIEQSQLDIIAGETPEQLEKRLLPIEHQTYVRALRRILAQPKTK